MNKRIQQNVMIKGTKDGLTLHLDDSCAFSELLKELESKLSANYQFQENDSGIAVKVHTGNRYLLEDQKNSIRELISQKKKLVVDEIISNVMTKEEAKRWKDEHQMTTIAKVIRSGQILEVVGDLLLIGDVNPGGTIIAGGNIFVMGALRGIAQAGHNGNRQSFISASVMKPSHIRIADKIMKAPDKYIADGHVMECAFVDETGHIIVEKIQAIKNHRPNFIRLEGGL